MKAFYTILLLIVSNIFMTFAWYGHLKLQEMKVTTHWPLFAVILLSWGIALFEYSVCRHPPVMGHRALRVFLPDSRQPHRLHGQRRAVLADAAQGHPRGHHAHHLHRLHHAVLQRRSVALEPFGGFRLPHPGSILCLYEMTVDATNQDGCATFPLRRTTNKEI